MAQELRKVIQIDTKKGANSVKSLRKEINELKDNLVNLDRGSEDYQKTLEEIATRQTTLQGVMNDTKSLVEAEKGSYNDLTNQMRLLNEEYKKTGDTARQSELAASIKEINDQLKDMDEARGVMSRNVGNYAKGVADGLAKYKEQVKQLKSELLELDEGSADYMQKLGQLGTLQKKMSDITQLSTMSANDLGQKLTNITQVASGVASGFAAAQGVMNLFGVESEGVAEALTKVQSAMAIAQGLQGLEGLTKRIPSLVTQFKSAVTGVKAFNASLSTMKKALISTGIGALVVALGELIAHWDTISKLFSANSKSAEELRKQYGHFTNQIDAMTDKQSDNIEVMKIWGANEHEIIAQQIKDQEELIKKYEAEEIALGSNKKTKEEYLEVVKKHEAALARIVELKRQDAIETEKDKKAAEDDAEKKKAENAERAAEAYKKVIEEREKERKAAQEIYDQTVENSKSELQLLGEKYAKEKTLLEKWGLDTALLTQQYEEERARIIKEQEQAILNEFEKATDNQVRALDDSIQEIRDKYSEMDFSVTIDGELDTEEELQETIVAIEAEKAAFIEAKTEENIALAAQIALYDELITKKQQASEDTTNDEKTKKAAEERVEQNNKAIVKKEEEAAQKKIEINKNYTKTIKAQEDEVKNYKLQTASSVLKSLSSIMGEQTATGKAMAVASATIDTYQAANAAYKAMAAIPYVGPAMGAAAAAAAVVAGIANVKKILSVDTSGNSSNSSISTSSTSSPQIATPNLNSLIPNTYQENILGNTETTVVNSDAQRVYVLESDITEAQKKVEVRENNSVF